MEWFEISGGIPLCGSITLQGSKNAALPLMAASILHKGRTTLYNVPDIRDVDVMIQILKNMGCQIKREFRTLQIDTSKAENFKVDPYLGEQMRSSIILLGVLLGRFQRAVLPFPGGCIIGARPIDIHITAMQKMGADFEEKNGLLYVSTKCLCGTKQHLRFPSVGATENAILAAVCAKGNTQIINCAREPEIIELCCFLREKGAKIKGEGTGEIWIKGVKQLKDSSYTLMPDRIVAGTYLFAAAATRGEICLKGAKRSDLKAVLHILCEMGAEFYWKDQDICINAKKAVCPIKTLCTGTYPDFPTDLQSQALAVLSLAKGRSRICETIFENRFRIAPWLNRMGAKIQTDGRTAVIDGVQKLHGTDVRAEELRGGAALVIAGLSADGITRVYESNFIERGYENMPEDLRKLGAKIIKKCEMQ